MIAPADIAIGDRVRFTETGAQGRSVATAVRLSPFDGERGPWHRVEFDNGLTCWCTESSLSFLTVFGWI